MKRRTNGALLAGSLAVVAVVATYIVLSTALTRALDPNHQCETGFSMWVSCTLQWSSTRVGQSTPDIDYAIALDRTAASSNVVGHCPMSRE